MGYDTLRVLVGWKCNLACGYCCNEREEVRGEIPYVGPTDFNPNEYQCVCISGGEPLMSTEYIARVRDIAERVTNPKTYVVLYTNGLYLTREIAEKLVKWGVDAINVGLHSEANPDVKPERGGYPAAFEAIILRVTAATEGLALSVRFHVNEKFARFGANARMYPGCEFKYWTMDDCDRGNETRVALEEFSPWAGREKLCQITPLSKTTGR